MGYTRKPKTYLLVFEGEEYAGLEIHMRGMSMGQMLDMTEFADGGQGRGLAMVREALGTLAAGIDSWNLETEDGQPITPSVEALRDLDMPFVLAIVRAWMRGVASVPAPLDQPSPGGVPSLEASIPMVAA